MNVIFTIQHPAHVHLFRNAIRELAADHRVFVFVRDKEVAVDLLNAYGIEHTVLATSTQTISRLPLTQLRYEYAVWRHARRIDPDVVVGVGGLTASHVAALTGATSLVFIDNDDRHAFANRLVVPFADVICTPRNLESDYGAKQDRYDGFHELAYLHPNRFTPDEVALAEHGVDVDEPFSVLRFVSWSAHHDIGQHGLPLDAKRELIELLSEYGDVYISSEQPLPAEFEPYRLPVPADRLLDLLYFADIYAGESGTMGTEAALLGTPTVRFSPLDDDLSNFVELEREYGLLYSRSDVDEGIRLVRELLDDPDRRAQWSEKREQLFEEKIDVTDYILERIRVAGDRNRGRTAPNGR